MNTIKHIELEKIHGHPENPNPHDQKKVESLAANIKEFGLINPILVKKNGEDFEIIAGEGRFKAYVSLYKATRDKVWSKIPCTEALDSDDYLDWGRRLSENKLRSFNWVAECIELANMKVENKTAKELGEIFNLDHNTIGPRVAIGECIKRIKTPVSNAHLTLNQFRLYILTLRIPPEPHLLTIPSKGQKDFQLADYSRYDYSEVKECIHKLNKGELNLENLPVYSAERRIVILEKERDKSEEAKIKEKSEEKIKGLQVKLTKEYEQKIALLKEQQENLEKELNELREAKDEDKDAIETIQKNLREKDGQIKKLYKRLEDLPGELRENLAKEIQAQKNEEYEKKLKKKEETAQKLKEALDKFKEKLDKKETKLKEEKEKLELQKTQMLEGISFDYWIDEADTRFKAAYQVLMHGRTKGFWDLLGKEHFRKFASSLNNLVTELRQLETIMKKHQLLK